MRLGGLYPRLPTRPDPIPPTREPTPDALRFVRPNSIDDLEAICDKLDCYGLSAIGPPHGIASLADEACARFGERAAALGIVIGELGGTPNMMTPDPELFVQRLATLRTLLRKAELMGCRTVHILVGSDHPSDHALAATPFLFSDACRVRLREIVLRALDGLTLTRTRFLVEPYGNSFFYQPEDIRAFLDTVDHPGVGLHLDIVNMISRSDFFNTTGLIDRTFALLADRVHSVHMKDLRWDPTHLIQKWDEVLVGEGVLDHTAYLTRVATLPPDTPCYCEHLADERDYALNFARLHHLAAKSGVRFLRRGEPAAPPRV
ncbi:MAG: sugar phosphate isomerase/epimerase [Actinobacteria bacterium]|nr:sugar phosphate isomerase/epimerase [Actinomycetota bacterium]